MRGGNQLTAMIHGRAELTLLLETREMPLQVVDGGKEYLDMEDELFCHPYRFEILAIADLPKHVGDTRSTRFLERRQDTIRQSKKHQQPKDALTSRSDRLAVPFGFVCPSGKLQSPSALPPPMEAHQGSVNCRRLVAEQVAERRL